MASDRPAGSGEEETREEEMERLKEEIDRREDRLRELRVRGVREDGFSLEDFEEMSPSERRQLKADDPDLWQTLQRRKRKQGEAALLERRGSMFPGA